MKIKRDEESLRSILLNAALAFGFGVNWRAVLRNATYSRPVGRERKFLVNTIGLSDESFGRVVDVMIAAGI